MDTNRLRYFVTAAETLNFSEVARIFFISQPAVSHQISLLEEELGEPLFKRNGKKLFLTETGAQFLPDAISILEKMDTAVLNVKRHREGELGKVSVVVASTCSVPYKQCLKIFSKYNPDVLIDTRIAIGREQSRILDAGDYDIFFTAEKIVAGRRNQLDYVVTHMDMLCLALPAGCPEPEDMSDFSALNKLPYIGLSSGDSTMIQDESLMVLSAAGYIPRIINQYNRIEALLMSVDAGIGIAVLPQSLTAFYTYPEIKYIPIPHSATACVGAWRKGNNNQAAVNFAHVIKRLFPKKANGILQDG